MELEVGKVLNLDNGQNFLLANHFMYEDKEYVALVSVDEPVFVKFAEVIRKGQTVGLEDVQDDDMITLFKQYSVNDYFSVLEDDEEDEE